MAPVTAALVALVAVVTAAAGCGARPAESPRAITGVLDLGDWDLSTDGPAALHGDWWFYPDVLLTPARLAARDAPVPAGTLPIPAAWNGAEVGETTMKPFGQGTYRLTLRLPSHDEQLAVRFESFGTAFRLYVDGVEASSAGVVGTDRRRSRPEWRPHVAHFPAARGGTVDLILQVSNHHHRRGGAIGAIRIGTERALYAERERALALELFLAGAILIVAIHHLALFALRRRERAPLYFGLFCGLLGIYTLLSGERYLAEVLPWTSWHLRVRVTNLMSFLAASAFVAFVSALFPAEMRSRATGSIHAPIALLSALAMTTPSRIYSFAVPLFHLVVLLACALSLVALLRAWRAGRAGAPLFLGGFAALFAAVLHDVLHDEGVIHTGSYTAVGLFAFICCQSFVLSRRFSTAFDTIASQRAELQRADRAQRAALAERARVQGALRESEERYRTLVENVPDLIFTMDAAGRLTSMNEYGLTLLGYTRDELVDQHWSRLVHPDDRARVDRVIEQTLDGRRTRTRGLRFRVRDRRGETLWASLNASASFDERGTLTRIHGALRDVTQEKRLEAQLLQAQRMEAIGTLAGGIAHDFNNLLMGIQGNVSLLRVTVDRESDDELRQIEQCVQDGSRLTRQLLGLAMGGKYDVVPTDLSRIARKTVAVFAPTRKDVRIRERYGEGLWPVAVDRSQFEQVLLNLLVNASQAMPVGGDITVECANVELDAAEASAHGLDRGRHAALIVRDSGGGMDEATRRRCFDPFFTTKGMGHGTGLGLASVYGIVTNHNGTIDVESSPGEGSTFRVLLPATDRPHVEVAETAEYFTLGSETVLLVDDEAMILQAAAGMLEKMGYTVIQCGSGIEAITRFEAERDRIDLVILDLVMPELGGGETFDALRALEPDVPVLLSSGYSIDGEAHEILDRGCNGFIQKPFTMEQLSRRIRRILDGGGGGGGGLEEG